MVIIAVVNAAGVSCCNSVALPSLALPRKTQEMTMVKQNKQAPKKRRLDYFLSLAMNPPRSAACGRLSRCRCDGGDAGVAPAGPDAGS